MDVESLASAKNTKCFKEDEGSEIRKAFCFFLFKLSDSLNSWQLSNDDISNSFRIFMDLIETRTFF